MKILEQALHKINQIHKKQKDFFLKKAGKLTEDRDEFWRGFLYGGRMSSLALLRTIDYACDTGT